MTCDEVIAPAEEAIQSHMALVAHTAVGMPVTLKRDHAGYIGCIEAVTYDNRHGVLYLVMVYSKKFPGEYLNGKGWTRQYRPRSDFDWGVICGP